MARSNDAFNTDDPVLIRVGELFRQSVAESWQADRLVVELQGVLMPLIPRPENKVIVANTPTFAPLSAGQSVERSATAMQALANTAKQHNAPPARAIRRDHVLSQSSQELDPLPDPLTVAAAFGEPEYTDNLGWDHPDAIFDPESFGDDTGRSLEDLS